MAFSPAGDNLVFSLSETSEPGLYLTGTDASFHRINRLSSDPSDREPLWLTGGDILFNRDDADGNSHIFRMQADGWNVRSASGPTRELVGGDIDGRRVLVYGGYQMYRWNVQTGAETPGPPVPSRINYISASPDGIWTVFLTGTDGEEVWRHRADQPDAEQVRVFAAGTSMKRAAIDNDGNIVLEHVTRKGDLWLARPPAGSRW